MAVPVLPIPPILGTKTLTTVKCPNKRGTICVLAGMQVRVRSVGVDGAGHSAWSEAAPAHMPAAPQDTAAAAQPSAQVAHDQAHEAPRKRRARKGGGERLLALADPKLSASLD